ncbi:MAG: glycosyltransferase [Nitrospirae bacterium]|nr:glycosyltransferase [Magnetococcales bacterium]HAT49312.1 glycosyltransferase [Alphaproteobacteria bacterium]
MENPVLMVAYHYPPAQASGTHRTLGFSRHLSDFGWKPLVLSAHPRAYECCDAGQGGSIPCDTVVLRPFALDTARHLSIRGRYARILAMPDRWSSWLLGAIPAGVWMVRRYRPKVIWSTYPIATSLLIGWFLSRWSGLPWVVDLRDPMVIGRHPVDPRIRRLFIRLEARILESCDRIVVTTPGLKDLLQQRYPNLPREKWQIIANGYDEDVFNDPEIVQAMAFSSKQPVGDKILTLLHSGTLYTGREERNPAAFLDALTDLKACGLIGSPQDCPRGGIRIQVIFRATGHDAQIHAMIQSRNLGDMVLLKPTLPYRESLLEMVAMDGLLLFQGEAFDRLIPAKLFEYLRSGRPVFSLIGEGGDSRTILDRCQVFYHAPLENREAIGKKLTIFLEDIATGRVDEIQRDLVRRYSRREGAKDLATLLDDVLMLRKNY